MSLKSIFFISIAICFILINVIFDSGCANMMPPEGGLRDSIPPTLLKANPQDSSKQFHASTITFTFDEFVQLQDPYNNVIISPVPKNRPNIDSRLRAVTVKFKDSLEPNTTYTINFGNAIRDVNEGNILKNFTYIFSTGNYFDSLSLNGNVVLAETGKVDTSMVVMLYKNPADSALTSEKPRYVTRVDGAGKFHFRNLPAGTFNLYAVKEESNSYVYSTKKLFAFADKPINTQVTNDSITLYAYIEQGATTPAFQGPTPGRNTAGEKRLRFSSNALTGFLDLLSDYVITFESSIKKLDTTKISLSHDSTFVPVAAKQITLDSTKRKLTIHTNWKENTLYHVILDKDFAEDTLGKKLLKTDTLIFKTKKLSEYASLRIRFRNFDPSKNPVLLFVQNDVVMRSESLTSADVNFPIFLPGEYDLRILYDRNKNGKWDHGQFFGKHIQPEIVTPINSRSHITVKANWQNEFDIQL